MESWIGIGCSKGVVKVARERKTEKAAKMIAEEFRNHKDVVRLVADVIDYGSHFARHSRMCRLMFTEAILRELRGQEHETWGRGATISI
jgi:hypothetical protein